MISVIIAGGSGTRLWPLSTPTKPKHLLALTGEQSLLQDAYARASMSANEIYVVTDGSHSDQVKEQLPVLDATHLIVEPARRGTASCIALALAHIKTTHPDNPTVAFSHADYHIVNKQGFTDAVKFAGDSAEHHDAIALIGIHPDFPATGYGYIKVGERLNGAFKVDQFKEKPDQKTAKKYFESGEYLWNLGLFAAPLNVFEREIKLHAKKMHKGYSDICKLLAEGKKVESRYLKFASEPIDTELIEKSKNVVVPGTFDWADIGSFKDLHDVMPKSDEFENAVKGAHPAILINTKGSMVITHNKPVAVIGLDDIAVIDTDEGLLVCHKEHAQEVKTATLELKKLRDAKK